MAFIFFFLFLKKFEKVEKTGIISTKFLLRCTPSVILGSTLNFLLSTPWKTVRLHGKKLQNITEELGEWGQKKAIFADFRWLGQKMCPKIFPTDFIFEMSGWIQATKYFHFRKSK